jgi:hypothetical protein
MKLINPIEITAAKITAYNVPQTEAIWSAGTTYALGARVVLDSFGATVYESLVASNVGNVPVTNPTKWLAVGASNYAAMFDSVNGTQTTKTDLISVSIKTTELINSIGLVNIDADSVRVTMTDDTYGLVYDKTISLKALPANDWYSFYFGEFSKKTNAVFDDLPPYRNATIKIDVASYVAGSIVKVGTIQLGKLEKIGYSEWGVKLGFSDYSRKDVDAFGNYIIIQRAYANTLDADVEIDTSSIQTIQLLRAKLRGIPVIWIGSSIYSETIVFGFFSNFDINLSNPIISKATLTIQGLT